MDISKKLFILIGFSVLIFCSMGSAFFISLTKSPTTLSQEYLQLSYVVEEHSSLIYTQRSLSYAPYNPDIWQAMSTILVRENDKRIGEALTAISNLNVKVKANENGKVAFLSRHLTQ